MVVAAGWTMVYARLRRDVFIEQLWRSLKYENVYLNAYETGSEARTGIGQWFDFYNRTRPHSSLDDKTPDKCYAEKLFKGSLIRGKTS